jgi:hypothetical protein
LEKSLKFKHIENNLLKLLALILNNQNILKYIYYVDSDDPLSQPEVTVNLLETNNIILTLFDEEILQENQVKVFLNPYQGNLKIQPLSDLTFVLDIIIPNSKWLLHGLGQLRPYRIADEFAQMVDGKMVAGIGDVEITKFTAYKVGTQYSGLSLQIKVNSSTMKGLR